MIKKYVEKKPSRIRAIQWRGDNFEEVDRFCTIKLDNAKIHYAELRNESHSRPEVLDEESRKRWSRPRIVLKGDVWCGDIAYSGDYIIAGDEFYHKSAAEFEAEYSSTNDLYFYVRKEPFEAEAVQWMDDNTEEVLRFLGSNGGIENSRTQILIMNSSGGSILEKGSFLVKTFGEYYSLSKKSFEKAFKEKL